MQFRIKWYEKSLTWDKGVDYKFDRNLSAGVAVLEEETEKYRWQTHK
jgi:hypothetical protein